MCLCVGEKRKKRSECGAFIRFELKLLALAGTRRMLDTDNQKIAEDNILEPAFPRPQRGVLTTIR